MISDSLDIDFIYGDIRGWSCNKSNYDTQWQLLVMSNDAVQIKMAEVDMRQMHNECKKSACLAWWRHQMENFVWLALCVVNSPVNSPHKGQWCRALKFSLICTKTNSWVNYRGTGDLRRHCVHCDVIVMALWRTFKNHIDYNINVMVMSMVTFLQAIT